MKLTLSQCERVPHTPVNECFAAPCMLTMSAFPNGTLFSALLLTRALCVRNPDWWPLYYQHSFPSLPLSYWQKQRNADLIIFTSTIVFRAWLVYCVIWPVHFGSPYLNMYIYKRQMGYLGHDGSFQGILRYFGNRALYLLPQSQINSWIPFLCLCVQLEVVFRASC